MPPFLRTVLCHWIVQQRHQGSFEEELEEELVAEDCEGQGDYSARTRFSPLILASKASQYPKGRVNEI